MSQNMLQAMTDENPRARLKSQIDENLKRVYDDALKEEIPDRFKLLLDQLRAQGQAPKGQK